MIQLFAFAGGAVIRATLLLLAAVAVGSLLRKRSAALQHAFWTAAMAASLSIPLLSLTLSDLGLTHPFPWRQIGSAAWARLESIGLGSQRNRVVKTSVVTAASAIERTTRSLFDVSAIFSSTPSEDDSANRTRQVVLAVWLMGLALFLSRILRSTYAVIRLRRSATEISDERITFIWRQIQRSTPSQHVLLVEAEGVSAPGTAGIFRPTIFLPREAAEWGAIRIRATLAHEYAHVVRRDCLTRLMADIIVAIYWFNPIVWYARRRMTTERERACDDLVLTDGVQPERYASVLVETVRGALLQQNVRVSGVLLMARPSELETRLVSILDPSRSRGRVSSRTTIVTASIVTAAAVLISVSHLDAAPPAKASAATKPVAQVRSLRDSDKEPDARGDSISGALSERVALSEAIWSAARNTAALSGPDSVLARKLYAQLPRIPKWEGDFVRDRSAWALSRQTVGGLLIDPLIESLGDRNWRIRAYAAWALGVSGSSRPVPQLVALLSDPNWRMRAMAAAALDAIGDQRATTAMVRATQDEAWQVRVEAVHFIGGLHDAQYQPLLQIALGDRHIAVRGAASEALDNSPSIR